MIALNEILKNREKFELQYNRMGVHHNIDKVIKLEQKFIILDDKKNKNRARCNKLCAEIANKINKSEEISSLVKQINSLDKQISSYEKKSKLAMKKINRYLRKLPNLPINDNLNDIEIPSKQNLQFSQDNISSELEKIAKIQTTNNSFKHLIKSYKKRVIKADNLPLIYKINSKNTSQFLIFGKEKLIDLFENLTSFLSKHAISLKQISIIDLKKDSSLEYQGVLSNYSKVSIEFLGEYISREISLKYYDQSLDMTKFVNMIRISINK